MKKSIQPLAFLFALAWVSAAPVFSEGEAPSKIVVIVKAHGALTGLNQEDVRAVYSLDKLTQGKVKIEPLVCNESMTHLFMKSLLNLDENGYKSAWAKKMLVEGLDPPRGPLGPADVVDEVSRNGHAIGFVEAKDIPKGQKSALKVICSLAE